MTVLEKLRAESLRIRKDRGVLGPFSVFAISEIEKVGKSAGNRPSTNDEAITAVKKMISTIDSNMSVVSDDFILEKLKAEKKMLESILPAMVSMEDVRSHLMQKYIGVTPTKGDLMKEVKAKFGSLADMKEVGKLATELFEI